MKKGTQLLEVYALEIQMYTAQKNNKRLKHIYEQSLRIKSAIPHPFTMGVIRGENCFCKFHFILTKSVNCEANLPKISMRFSGLDFRLVFMKTIYAIKQCAIELKNDFCRYIDEI